MLLWALKSTTRGFSVLSSTYPKEEATMAYIVGNPPTKKAAKEMIAAAKAKGLPGVEVFQPGPFGPEVKDGRTTVEGPHYPQPHKWYGQATVKNGYVTEVK